MYKEQWYTINTIIPVCACAVRTCMETLYVINYRMRAFLCVYVIYASFRRDGQLYVTLLALVLCISDCVFESSMRVRVCTCVRLFVSVCVSKCKHARPMHLICQYEL